MRQARAHRPPEIETWAAVAREAGFLVLPLLMGVGCDWRSTWTGTVASNWGLDSLIAKGDWTGLGEPNFMLRSRPL